MKNRGRLFAAIVITALAFAILNMDVSIKQGIDGRYRDIHMPLYVKWAQFLARHYEYARISREITRGRKTDEEKVLAILTWTRGNLKDVPPGMPLYDDHILNIIIKGYAVPEQFQDVFTTLCSYSGIPAFFGKVYDKAHKAKYILSFVELDGKWRVFDAYKGIYFRTKYNEIASVEDIINDRSLVRGADVDTAMVRGVPYKEFYYNLAPVTRPVTLRAEKQMPLHRLFFETKKALKIEKDE